MSKFFYALYDLANSAYTMIVITFVTSAYFANQIVGDPQVVAAYWQWTAGICGIVIALTGPFLGALADKKPQGKINFLQIFTLLCILTTCLIWFAKQNPNYIKRYTNNVPKNRMAKPEDFLSAIAFLSSVNSGYFTGQNLIVDGGIESLCVS